MITKWIKTGTGTYIQIFEPDFEGLYEIEPPTEEEQIVASYNYMIARFSEAFAQWFMTVGRMADVFARWAETLDILSDDETMAAIQEGVADDTD